MGPVEPLTLMDLLAVEASLLTMDTEHLVEDLVAEPPLPAETMELLVEAAEVDLAEEGEAAPPLPAAPTGLLEVDLREDSGAVPPLPVDRMAPLVVEQVVEVGPPLQAAPMALPEVDVVAVEVADVAVAAPHPQVDLTALPEVDLRVDLEEAPRLPVDLMAPLLLEVAEDLEALVAVTRLVMAMLVELPRPVDLTALQVVEEAQEDLAAALLLPAATTALLEAVTSLDTAAADAAEAGPAAGTASSSSDPGEARPPPSTGRMSATSLAGPPSLTGSRTRTQQQPTR